MSKVSIYIFILLIGIAGLSWYVLGRERFSLPQGETVLFDDQQSEVSASPQGVLPEGFTARSKSGREIFITDGVRHSISLDEILSGGPPKDGIPSIDDPKFVGTQEADDFLTDTSIGLGIFFNGEARFYPYQILVWHEIVNDNIQGSPILVTYCPLCGTGIVFDRRVDGVEQEFGVSGLLWRSNLLMYNRTGNADTESLWSQVLGEAVLGPQTGTRLPIFRSDTVRYSAWKDEHPNTLVLSRDTGSFRNYGADPYGSYYVDETVGFGATFRDTRLHPKAFVIGIEIDGKFKAYHLDALREGETVDTFNGEKITLQKSSLGEVDVFRGEEKEPLSSIDGFWFSWLAAHENSELYK